MKHKLKHPLKITFRILKNLIAMLLLLLLSYLFLCVVLPLIPRESKKTIAKKEVEIYFMKSGVHTDFLVPVHHPVQNWDAVFPYENNKIIDTTFHYLAIGWGDKEFYLNTPTWGDLTVATAVKAASGMSGSAVHAYYYYEIPSDRPVVKLKLTQLQYTQLCKYIKTTLRYKNHKPIFLKPRVAGTTFDYDSYYDAKGSYSILTTCNTWINSGLMASGQKACYWTAFSEGILYQYGK
jgi:hypothetical protein